jgi:hypothetical protein
MNRLKIFLLATTEPICSGCVVASDQQLAVYDQMREETLRSLRATAQQTGSAPKPAP